MASVASASTPTKSEVDGERLALRIGITGSYGGLNLGDEAILTSILAQLRSMADVDVVVFSRSAEDTARRHRVQAFSIRNMTREESREVVRGLDLLILGGGGILFDDEVEAFLREVILAQELAVPVVVYAVSAGPLKEQRHREAVRDALNGCAAITVRDRHGCRLLEDVGVSLPIRVTADAALLLEPEPLQVDALQREGLDPARRLVGFSVREPGPAAPDLDVEHYHALVANTADFVIDRFDADVVFVPMERDIDPQHSHAVMAKMKHSGRASVLRSEYSPGELLSLVRHFQFAVGMRLHFLVFAARQGIPFVSLPYASKVSGFIEELDLPAPPLATLNAGTLLAHVDRSWDLRDQLRERISRGLPTLIERARENHAVLANVLAAHARREP